MTTLLAGICCTVLFFGGGLVQGGYPISGMCCGAFGSITLAVLFGHAKRG